MGKTGDQFPEVGFQRHGSLKESDEEMIRKRIHVFSIKREAMV